ncbi:hypothetical protein EDD18DRAFT_1455757 [Armillaria luteobubalina]|uniref:Heterokaryon incompatibility domain-containing protein n=1 Tax=Armillaria luteobubalina TaxID=153913 RepID=A0AA39QR98_9AGAR|nr:hypothetical protein EDD18DRAFT_1455757 [Armillaria luteobubalina]
MPKGVSLDLIRIEMLNVGVQYVWLDVLCLRQRGGPREDLRAEEWKLDVPIIGAIYDEADVVYYLSGLGLPLTLKEGDLESDRCWFRRAWTEQEVGQSRTIAGDTPDGPLHTKPIDDAGNYEDKILTKFHRQLDSAKTIHGLWRAIRDAGSDINQPTYYESQSLEDAWTALVNEMSTSYRARLLFTYPEPGTGCKKWRPSWKQAMEKPLPSVLWDKKHEVQRDDDDWCEGDWIERGFVRGLAVGGEEAIDRCGELIVENAHGISYAFPILASHQYPIPEDTYTLLSDNLLPLGQYWAVGRRLSNKMFEKMSVFEITDFDERKRLDKLDLSAWSHSILA